jgi:hypothetical protein
MGLDGNGAFVCIVLLKLYKRKMLVVRNGIVGRDLWVGMKRQKRTGLKRVYKMGPKCCEGIGGKF